MTAGESRHSVPPCGCLTRAASASTCYCAVENLLAIIRRRYSLAVLRIVEAGQPARFHAIAAGVGAASPSTLTETLNALATGGLIRRHGPDGLHGVPVYTMTASGSKLLARLRHLSD